MCEFNYTAQSANPLGPSCSNVVPFEHFPNLVRMGHRPIPNELPQPMASSTIVL